MGEFRKFLRKFFHVLVFVYILYLIYNYNLRFTKYTNFPNVIALRNTIADTVIAENKYWF